MLVDVDWVSVAMTDVRFLINGLLKVATLNSHLGGLRHLGNPVLPVVLKILGSC